MPPADSTAGFALQTPTGTVLVSPLALAVVVGVLAGVLIAFWLMQRRQRAPHP